MIEIFYANRFKKDVKKLLKKNKRLRQDIDDLIQELLLNPSFGTSLGNNCYKIRLKDSSSTKGKRGGYRVITYLLEKNKKIILLTIYSKSAKSTVTDEEIRGILQELQ
jgi:mRNA-degrading endonuclease RelE of RelBE toxin-antitoxin system